MSDNVQYKKQLKEEKKEEEKEAITENSQKEITDFKAEEENGEDSELLQKIEEEIIRAKKASASFLQRRFRIGYARAARILDILEEKGIIGPADGAKPREVYGASPEEKIGLSGRAFISRATWEKSSATGKNFRSGLGTRARLR